MSEIPWEAALRAAAEAVDRFNDAVEAAEWAADRHAREWRRHQSAVQKIRELLTLDERPAVVLAAIRDVVNEIEGR